MKYKEGNFFQVSHDAMDKLSSNKLKISAKWLFIVLCKLENRLTGPNRDSFFRSIKDLKEDSGLSEKTIVDGIKELKRVGLIQKFPMHYKNEETGKLSEKHINSFRVLDDHEFTLE